MAICIPCQSQVAAEFAYDLARLTTATAVQRPDIELRLFLHQGSILLNQRQDLVKKALEAEATHILWLDSDMRFPKDTLVRLLTHSAPVVAANYTTRKHPLRPVAVANVAGQREALYTPEDATGLAEAEYTGMGVMLVNTDVFRQLPQPWFAFWYNEKTGTYAGEDTFFCFCAREAGIRIQIDQDLSKQVKHVGTIEYDTSDAIDVQKKIIDVAMAELGSGN